MQKEKLEKIVRFFPAWDKRNPNPLKNYGIGAVRVIMCLKGKRGAIHFVFSTGMYLKETEQEYAEKGMANPHKLSNNYWFIFNAPMGYDVGYHSPKPMFRGQTISQKKCNWIGKSCYCDGSALRADKWLDILIRKGDKDIWKMMEKDYYSTFK